MDDLIALHKSHDDNSLLSILVKIRRELDSPIDKKYFTLLQNSGCLKHLIKIFGKSRNKQIIDISLSILGNCLKDRSCAKEVVIVHDILFDLQQLLKKYPDEDSIIGRMFRIMGNLCEHKDRWEDLIIEEHRGFVAHGLELLKTFSKDEIKEKNSSEATVMMTIRALRLFENRRTIITLVRHYKVLKVIGSLFVKLSQEWEKNGKNDILLLNIIKLLCEYSKYSCYQSIIQMRNTDRGDSLLHLSNILLLAPKRVVKIVMNFIKVCQLQSELPIPEICDKFIDVLVKSLKEKGLQKHSFEYIECLSYMFENPINRNIQRCGKCIPLLIQVIDSIHKPSGRELELCILIMVILNRCTYNDILIQMQLKCNIIEIILKKMQWITGYALKFDDIHKKYKVPRNGRLIKHVESGKIEPLYGKRTKYSCDKDYDLNILPLSARSEWYSNYYDEGSLGRWPFMLSPSWKSHSIYGKSLMQNQKPESDSDEYSPVTSEADPTELRFATLDNRPRLGMLHGRESAELIDDDINIYPSTKHEHLNTPKIRLLIELTRLLKSFVRIRPALPQLGTEKMLWSLLKSVDTYECLHNCKEPLEVIGKILVSPEYLLPLMNSHFISKLYKYIVPDHKECGTCKDNTCLAKYVLDKLTALAESESGKGEIAHKLLRGTSDVRQHLVLVIPYIIWDKTILGKLMMDCGGLDILMKILGQQPSIHEHTYRVLCLLASKNLKIANPRDVTLDLGKRESLTFSTYKLENDCTRVVRLNLDDGSFLDADREFLCEKSDFFDRLLNGHFKESNEDEVSLHNVEHKSLGYLLQFLKLVDTTANLDVKIDLETLLDIILLSDRYLLSDLCVSLINSVEKFRISRKSVPIIYKWSLESGTNFLRIETIAYVLVADVSVNQKISMFKKLFTLGYSTEILEDIHKLLARYLNSSRSCVDYRPESYLF